MRLSRSRLTQACVYFGVGWPKHASISESDDPGMRLSGSRLTQACVYLGVGWPKHASISEPADPGMRLSRSRLTQACVYFGVGWPKHASISEPADPGMRLFRSRLTQACVYFGVGWPKHASISASDGRSMRLFPLRENWPEVGVPSRPRALALLAAGVIGAGFALPRDAGRRPALQAVPALLRGWRCAISRPAGPRCRSAGPHRENWPEVRRSKPSSRSCSVGSRRHWCRFRAPARCRSETGAPSRPRASSRLAMRDLAARRAAVPVCRPPPGELARGRRSKPSSRSCSVGSRHHWCRFRAPARCRSETGAPSSCRRWQHAFRDGVGTRCGCEGRGAVRPEPT